MNVVAHNFMAMNAARQLNIVNGKQQKKTEKLSSGYRINRSADDAAGLSISEKMRWQIRGLDKSVQDLSDGNSYCQVAEGALGEIHSMLDRMKELSIQAANDTNTSEDRKHLDDEVQQLRQEMDRTFTDTEYNTIKIWPEPQDSTQISGGTETGKTSTGSSSLTIIPSVSGNPTDFALYNNADVNGKYLGGIVYGGHRYSWEDLGIAYDRGSQTFLSDQEIKIDNSILSDDPDTSIDDDFSNAAFSLRTIKGETLDKIEKTYDWEATDDGISIDGVPAKNRVSVNGGDTTWKAAGMTPGANVKAGTYNFDYYGMKIAVKTEKDLSWQDFIDEINKSHGKINWHSINAGVVNAGESANINKLNIYMGPNSHWVFINDNNKDLINPNGYSVHADHDYIGITYNNGITKRTPWTKIKDTKSPAVPISSWGDSTGGSSKSDTIGTADDSGSSKVTIGGNSVYRYDDTADGGLFSFDFTLNPNASEQSIIDDLNSTTLGVFNTRADTKMSVYMDRTYSKESAIYLKTSVSAYGFDVDFFTQRDVIKRNFDYTSILSGDLTRTPTGGYTVTLSNNGNGNYTFSTDDDIRKEFIDDIKNRKSFLIKHHSDWVDYSADRDANAKIQRDIDKKKGTSDEITDEQKYHDEHYQKYLEYYKNYYNTNSDFLKSYYNQSLGLGTFGKYEHKFTGPDGSFTLTYYVGDYSLKDVLDMDDTAIEEFVDNLLNRTKNVNVYASDRTYQTVYYHNATSSEDIPKNGVVIQKTEDSHDNTGKDDDKKNITEDKKRQIHLNIQSGALAWQGIPLDYDFLRAKTLGIGDVNVRTYDAAQSAIDMLDHAIDKVSEQRAVFGSYMNRFEHAIAANMNTSENTSAAESRIRDADMSKECVEYYKNNILLQSGQSVLVHSYLNQENVLKLLQ